MLGNTGQGPDHDAERPSFGLRQEPRRWRLVWTATHLATGLHISVATARASPIWRWHREFAERVRLLADWRGDDTVADQVIAIWNELIVRDFVVVKMAIAATHARLAREMVIALPHQVGLDIHVAMLRSFITANLTPRGMIADVAIHAPPVHHGGDPRNWHAHVLLTDRPVTARGFAAKKDRNLNARAELLAWRKAWADIHNTTMIHLGLPHRIDHRSLEAQRQDALARGDQAAALDLNREPQIHVGKAVHVTHPDRAVYADRRARNEAILTRNKERAAVRADRMRGQIARADNDAYLEARTNAYLHDMLELETSVPELHARYGRPEPKTSLGRIRATMLRAKADKRAMDIARTLGFPWRAADNNRPDAPSVFDILKPMIATTGPGHPVFTVTAKDIAFASYHWGFISRRALQASLENIAEEEQRLFAAREARKKQPITWPPPRRPAKLPTPKAEHLARLRSFAHVPENIYLKRIDQLNAFAARHQAAKLRSARRRAPKHLPVLKRPGNHLSLSRRLALSNGDG